MTTNVAIMNVAPAAALHMMYACVDLIRTITWCKYLAPFRKPTFDVYCHMSKTHAREFILNLFLLKETIPTTKIMFYSYLKAKDVKNDPS